jgi:hypothetical protein
MITGIHAFTQRIRNIKPDDQEVAYGTPYSNDIYDPAAYRRRSSSDDDASLNILEISKVLYQCLGSEGHKGSETWMRAAARLHPHVENEPPTTISWNVVYNNSLQKMIYIICHAVLKVCLHHGLYLGSYSTYSSALG